MAALTFSLVLLLIGSISCDQVISKDGCGRRKGCLLEPDGCDPAKGECVRGLTYRQNGEWVDFELLHKLQSASGSVGKYVAIGFSVDPGMGNDAVTYCLYSPSTGHLTASLAYNPGQYNELITDRTLVGDHLGNVTGGLVDGVLHCRFSQRFLPPANNAKVYSLDRQYYPLLATGTASADQNGIPSKLDAHSMEQGGQFYPKAMSSAPISFKFSANTNVTSRNWNMTNNTNSVPAPIAPRNWRVQLVQAHAILMLFGWWLLVACAILIARYFKSFLSGRELCGIAYWFQLHRALNIVGVLSIGTAFVCMFVAKEGVWVTNEVSVDHPAGKHAILGMAASIGAFLQPIMALFRCDKHAPARPLFNWAHRILGLGAWCCASGAIWYSTEFFYPVMQGGPYGEAPRAMIIFYWAILGLAIVGLEVWITVHERLAAGRAVENDIAMNSLREKKMEKSSTAGTTSSQGVWLRGLLLALFALVAIAVTVTLACFIAM